LTLRISYSGGKLPQLLFIWKYLNSSSFLKSSFGRYKIPG
jgi:hypothetical protein